MLAREIMTREPVCCAPDDTIQFAARMMTENDCGCLPVVEGSNGQCVIGVITDRDIAVRAVGRGKPSATPVREVMTDCAFCCGADADVHEIEDMMSDCQVRRVVITDASGRCLGIVAQADLALAAEQGEEVSDAEIGRVVERISEPARGST